MQQVLTPKQVARAIGVSESSLKRWCDRGVIQTERTAGGHRRLKLGDVLIFLRKSDLQLVRPEVLGLPPGTGVRPRVVDRSETQLVDALLASDVECSRRLVFDLFINGADVITLCDEIFMPAMYQIGEQWDCGEIEIYQERRACEIIGQLVYELQSVLPAVDVEAPLAMGGTPVGDNYRLPTQMLELVFTSFGWRATSLGSGLPFETMLAAVQEYQPSLFWLSVSHVQSQPDFRADFGSFCRKVPPTTRIVVGGRAIARDFLEDMESVEFCDNLRDLQRLAEKSQAS